MQWSLQEEEKNEINCKQSCYGLNKPNQTKIKLNILQRLRSSSMLQHLTCWADKSEVQWVEEENHILLAFVIRQLYLKCRIHMQNKNKFHERPYNWFSRNLSIKSHSCDCKKKKNAWGLQEVLIWITYIDELLIKDSLCLKIWCWISNKGKLTLNKDVRRYIQFERKLNGKSEKQWYGQ